jgi:hypothetical protein
MKIKSVLTASLLAFVIVSLGVAIADVAGLRSTKPSEPQRPTDQPPGEQWVVSYFHSSTRCPTCRRFEVNTREAFAKEVKEGSVQVNVLNYEEPSHRHCVAEFDLAFPSIILLHLKDGSTMRWKNLDRIWDLWDDGPGFVNYVRTELAAFKEARP